MILDSAKVPLDPNLREFWYNSLDCCVTLEIAELLLDKPEGRAAYNFELGLQGPVLDMMLRGFLVDDIWRQWNIKRIEREMDKYQEALDRLAFGVWGKSLNPRSYKQKLEFFYEVMRFPVQYEFKSGERKPSCGRSQLENLLPYYKSNPFVNLILELQDRSKMKGTLNSLVDPDGKMRCTYNIGGTETTRFSSAKNVYGRGTNLQNQTEYLRRMYVADLGYILVNLDGEQAESRKVGFIQGIRCNDWKYLDACEDGDLHTNVAKLVWPGLPWTGDYDEDKAIAERLFYRHFTHRFMAKRGGHLTNYYGGPMMMAKSLKIDYKLAEEFQLNYAKGPNPAFPGFRKWWTWVGNQLTLSSKITTLLGHERTFFGRPADDSTLREAIAYEPQCAVAQLVNEGGRRVWERHPEAQPLAQVHDSWVFQIPESRLDLIPQMIATFEVPVKSNVRTLRIPAEAKVGWNWAPADPKREMFSDGNPDGLVKWKGSDQRRRTETPSTSLLDRVLY